MEHFIADDGEILRLRIVGADYDLGSGAVDFFATEPQAWPTGA